MSGPLANLAPPPADEAGPFTPVTLTLDQANLEWIDAIVAKHPGRSRSEIVRHLLRFARAAESAEAA
jgi:Arc/MetJ-type ribon-helix-helix transcriptional regulator